MTQNPEPAAPVVEVRQTLTSDCGHHCGVFVPDRGGSYRIVGHCPCPECHDGSEAPE